MPEIEESSGVGEPKASGSAKSATFADLLVEERFYARVFVGLALVVALAVLVAYMRSPILDMHGFRQTQTAISAYWIEQGHGVLAYQTPVTGAPWTIPFEAPVYQISVALVDMVTPFGLDAAGRLTSFLYLLGAIFLGWKVLRELAPDNELAGYLFAGLMLCSPQYLYWGRTFLVETCAIFFGVMLLYGAIRFYRTGSIVALALALVGSVLCVLAKSTSWPAFAFLAGLFWIAECISTRRIKWSATTLLVAIAAGSVALTLYWNEFADAQKSRSVFGATLTSANLSGWNFGSLDDRLGGELWLNILPDRVLPAALGVLWPIVLAGGLVIAVLRFGGSALLAAAGVVAFFTPLALFTNLHIVHNYYQTANALFLVAAIAVLLGVLAQSGRPLIAVGLAVIVAAGQLYEFSTHYKPSLDANDRNTPTYAAGVLARELVPEGRSLYVFGVDWSSEVNYYAERKGIAFAVWFGPNEIRQALAKPEDFVGSETLGGAVDCRDAMLTYSPEHNVVIDAFLDELRRRPGARAFEARGGCMVVGLP